MEWFVPAQIAPLRFLAYNAISRWRRDSIVQNGERGAIVIQRIKDEIDEPSTDRFTVGNITFETSKQKKLGRFVMSRKRVKGSMSFGVRKKIRHLLADDDD